MRGTELGAGGRAGVQSLAAPKGFSVANLWFDPAQGKSFLVVIAWGGLRQVEISWGTNQAISTWRPPANQATRSYLKRSLSKILCQEFFMIEFGFEVLAENLVECAQMSEQHRVAPAPLVIVEIVG